MAELHLYDVIRRPVITEKSTEMADGDNKYVFEVAQKANKIQVKEAVEEIFDLEGKVIKVNTMVMPAKRDAVDATRIFGPASGKRRSSRWKMACRLSFSTSRGEHEQCLLRSTSPHRPVAEI